MATIYDTIAEGLKSNEGQSVLVLGPDLSVDQNNISYKSYFRSLERQGANGIATYFPHDNLFAFTNDNGLRNTRASIKEFYNRSGDAVLLELISRLKFPLVINLCPDVALNKVFYKKNLDFVPAYFSQARDGRFKDLAYPNKDKPILYNIFGTAEVDTTLILNHSKLYEMIQELLSENSLPLSLETFLDHATTFVLLGVKFDTWYYQLICHKLKLREFNSIKTNVSAMSSVDRSSVSTVVREYFGIDFQPENPTQAIEKIILSCAGDRAALRDSVPPDSLGLYVSYAWKEKGRAVAVTRETPVDWAQKYSALSKITTLKIFRDHDTITYGDSIDSFMTRIGKGKTVIRVVSEKYLESRFCMMEALRMAMYTDSEKRIFTILWEDVNLARELDYREYWKKRCQSILEEIDKKLDDDNYDDAVQIFRFMPMFMKELRLKVNLTVGAGDFTVNDANGEISIIPERKEAFENFIKAVIGTTNL